MTGEVRSIQIYVHQKGSNTKVSHILVKIEHKAGQGSFINVLVNVFYKNPGCFMKAAKKVSLFAFFFKDQYHNSNLVDLSKYA